MRENAGPDTAGGWQTLTLTLARGEAGVLTVAATQGHGTAPAVRTVAVPWAADPAFRAALLRFWADGRKLLAMTMRRRHWRMPRVRSAPASPECSPTTSGCS